MSTVTSRRGLVGLPAYRAAHATIRARAVPQSRCPISATVKQEQSRGHSIQFNSQSLDSAIHHGRTPKSAPASSSSKSARHSVHSRHRRTSAAIASLPDMYSDSSPDMESSRAPLSVLPLTMLLRNLATASVSSSPALLVPSLRIMSVVAHSNNPILSPDRNPLLRVALKKTFYAQFCAGENAAEVNQTISNLKNIGFTGVMLCYAREVVLSAQKAKAVRDGKVRDETPELVQEEMAPWARGTLDTVRFAQPGDFVSLKFTGAGSLALYQLSNRLPCSPYLDESINNICKLASDRGVRLAIDAEQDALQDGIDDWTFHFARKYNQNPANPTVFGTYQAYKKCAPQVMLDHLADAKKNGYTLGVKLVRGAYLNSDPRERLHDTVEETHACFDNMAASLLTRSWNSTVRGKGEYPDVSMVLATHNAESVRRARAICEAGSARSPFAFAQLQGMADEVSCGLVVAGMRREKVPGSIQASPRAAASALPTFKYLAWGSTGECMKYLLRRAQENKDAVGRTRSSRDAMWAELVRRCKASLGMTA